MVTVVVAVVVVVSEVVAVLVGVVTWHPWKLPCANASTIALSVATMASLSAVEICNTDPMQLTVTATPAGPRYSVNAAPTAVASGSHVPTESVG